MLTHVVNVGTDGNFDHDAISIWQGLCVSGRCDILPFRFQDIHSHKYGFSHLYTGREFRYYVNIRA